MENKTPAQTVINTHTFTVGASDNGPNAQRFLVRDGRPVQCHKQPPVIVPKVQKKTIQTSLQNDVVEYVPQHIPCSLDCGKANIMEINGVVCWQQTCDMFDLTVRLQTAEEEALAASDQKKK